MISILSVEDDRQIAELKQYIESQKTSQRQETPTRKRKKNHDKEGTG